MQKDWCGFGSYHTVQYDTILKINKYQHIFYLNVGVTVNQEPSSRSRSRPRLHQNNAAVSSSGSRPQRFSLFLYSYLDFVT
jgi:hypothetical protein